MCYKMLIAGGENKRSRFLKDAILGQTSLTWRLCGRLYFRTLATLWRLLSTPSLPSNEGWFLTYTDSCNYAEKRNFTLATQATD